MTKRIVLLALPFLAACATAQGAPASLGPSEWRFTLIDGTKPVSGEAKLTIQSDQIGANVGCNGMGGDLKIEGNKLVVGPMISTKMWCDGVMDQEMDVEQLLSASPTWQLTGGKLILTSPKHSAELEPAEK